MEDQMKQRVKSMYGYALRQGACSLDEVPRFVMEILEEDPAQDAIDDLISAIPAAIESALPIEPSASVI
ncbi:MAG: hypothetical protein AAF289_10330 [Cyanobacteria bacterium P01_A01_bin.135]